MAATCPPARRPPSPRTILYQRNKLEFGGCVYDVQAPELNTGGIFYLNQIDVMDVTKVFRFRQGRQSSQITLSGVITNVTLQMLRRQNCQFVCACDPLSACQFPGWWVSERTVDLLQGSPDL